MDPLMAIGACEPSVATPTLPARSNGNAGHALTPRERAVLAHLARGLTNKEIARALDVTYLTVKQYLKHIYRKLGVNNRVAAAVWYHARHNGNGHM